jgi:hypothetical protein
MMLFPTTAQPVWYAWIEYVANNAGAAAFHLSVSLGKGSSAAYLELIKWFCQ